MSNPRSSAYRSSVHGRCHALLPCPRCGNDALDLVAIETDGHDGSTQCMAPYEAGVMGLEPCSQIIDVSLCGCKECMEGIQ